MGDPEHSVWGIHGSREGSADTLFLKENVVALGWNEMGDVGDLKPTLDACIKAAGSTNDFKGYLFRSTRGKTKIMTGNPLAQSTVYRMIRRRAMLSGIKTRNHTSRATGITQYLRNGSRRDLAQQMAAHESPRTTALFDRRDGDVAVDEVERILI
jgi:integrase/recombinase XerD